MSTLREILTFLLTLAKMTPQERSQPEVSEAAQGYADQLEYYLDQAEESEETEEE